MTLDDRNQKVLAAGKARKATLWPTPGVKEGIFDSHRLWTEESLIPERTTPYWAVQWSWFAQVNAICNLSRKKSREVAASLPGQFMSRRCSMLCITMEVETRIAKQNKCHHCCSCKNYWGKGMEGGKKESLRCFFADRKIASSWEKCILGHPIARATIYCLFPHIMTTGLKKCL